MTNPLASWRLPKGVWSYALADYGAAVLSWGLFVVFRRMVIEGRPMEWSVFLADSFKYSIVVVPIVWLLVYVVLDSYHHIYRLSRLRELARTLMATLIGGLLLFFTVLLDDLVNYLGGYQAYYRALGGLMSIHFVCALTARWLVLTAAHRRCRSGRFAFKTLVIGQHPKSLEFNLDLMGRSVLLG